MLKYSDEDIINCCACGYNSCEMMSTAIFNKLNKTENCSYYREKTINKERKYLEKMVSKIKDLVDATEQRKKIVESIASQASDSEIYLQKTIEVMTNVENSIIGISEITEIINSIASNTNLLSINAAIEAVHAGEAGKTFAVVANEVGKVAELSERNAKKIARALDKIIKEVAESKEISGKTTSMIKEISEKITSIVEEMLVGMTDVTTVMSEIFIHVNTIKKSSSDLTDSIVDFNELSGSVNLKIKHN